MIKKAMTFVLLSALAGFMGEVKPALANGLFGFTPRDLTTTEKSFRR